MCGIQMLLFPDRYVAVFKYLQPCAQILTIKLTCAATSVDANVLVASFQNMILNML